jgi:hypothetical protein
LMAMMLPLTLLWVALVISACSTRNVAQVIPADRWVTTLQVGVPFTPTTPGKFVPLAQYLDMQDAYLREANRKK